MTIGEVLDRYGRRADEPADPATAMVEPAEGRRPMGASEYARLLAENERYADAFDRSALTAAPLSGLAIVACMDARIDVEEALGLRTGDAHIIRNAGRDGQ